MSVKIERRFLNFSNIIAATIVFKKQNSYSYITLEMCDQLGAYALLAIQTMWC